MLTYEERNYVFDKLKNFISDNYVEKELKKAKTRAEAIKRARQIVGYSGRHGRNIPSFQCWGSKGIYAKMPDGREAIYRWGEFVDYVLDKQVSIFDRGVNQWNLSG